MVLGGRRRSVEESRSSASTRRGRRRPLPGCAGKRSLGSDIETSAGHSTVIPLRRGGTSPGGRSRIAQRQEDDSSTVRAGSAKSTSRRARPIAPSGSREPADLTVGFCFPVDPVEDVGVSIEISVDRRGSREGQSGSAAARSGSEPRCAAARIGDGGAHSATDRIARGWSTSGDGREESRMSAERLARRGTRPRSEERGVGRRRPRSRSSSTSASCLSRARRAES